MLVCRIRRMAAQGERPTEAELMEFKSAPSWELPQLVGPTGAWLGRAATDLHHHDPGLAAALSAFIEFQKPRRVIDMGCGLGEYVRAIRTKGVECDGFDGHTETSKLTDGLCYTADFADLALPDEISKVGYDWCICLEVFEHVPVDLEEQLVKCMLAGAGKGLVVSVATPGQGGLGHVNERPHEYVMGLLESKGFVLDVRTQMRIRKYCVLPWFQMNTLVFRRSEEVLVECIAKSGQEQPAGALMAVYTVDVLMDLMQAIEKMRDKNMQPADTRDREIVFDAAVSLGPNCLAAKRIEKAGLKRRAFPFDIIMSGSDGCFSQEEVCPHSQIGLGRIADFLSPDEDGVPLPPAHCYDDPCDATVVETYRRRSSRFLQLLSSDYRVLFVYTLRLRDLIDPSKVLNVARRLVLEVERLCALLAKCWPSCEYQLLIPVLGELRLELPMVARIAMLSALERLEAFDRGHVALERIRDAPAGPAPMDGFWGDEDAWAELFQKYRVVPRDFSETIFAQSTKGGALEGARPEEAPTPLPAKFERWIDSLVHLGPEQPIDG